MPTSLCTVFALSPSVVIVAIFLFGVRWFGWLVAFGWPVDWTRLGPFSRGGVGGDNSPRYGPTNGSKYTTLWDFWPDR